MGSGNTLRALLQYGQDLGSSEYGNVWNRRQTENNQGWNRLASLAGIGQTANNTIGTMGANYANNLGNLAMQNASTQGDAALAGANVWGNTLRDLGMFGGRYMAGMNQSSPLGFNDVSQGYTTWSPSDYSALGGKL